MHTQTLAAWKDFGQDEGGGVGSPGQWVGGGEKGMILGS